MKTHVMRMIAGVDTKSLLLGIVLGFGVGIYIFSLLVPSGIDMIKLYRLEKYNQGKGTYSIPSQR